MRLLSCTVAALMLGTSVASAQLANTGAGTLGSTDPNWSFSCTKLVSSMADCNASGAAFIPATIPSPPWQPDNGTSSGPNWISGWQSASSSSGTGDNAQNYQYDFWTTVGASGFYGLNLGWDNQLVGVFQNSVLLYGPSRLSGFCRDGDGVFPSSAFPNCLSSTVLALNSAYPLEVIIKGDGTTDGIFLQFDNGGRPEEVVPEPATMGLLATGLAGIMGAGLRRRRRTT
jgi:hypothetical protein